MIPDIYISHNGALLGIEMQQALTPPSLASQLREIAQSLYHASHDSMYIQMYVQMYVPPCKYIRLLLVLSQAKPVQSVQSKQPAVRYFPRHNDLNKASSIPQHQNLPYLCLYSITVLTVYSAPVLARSSSRGPHVGIFLTAPSYRKCLATSRVG